MPEVEIPGIGVVEFPYDMPLDQIAAHAKRLYDEGQRPKVPLMASHAQKEQPLTLERQTPGTPSALESGHAEGVVPTHPMTRVPGMVGDLAVGAGKELARQGIEGGAMLRKIPGVSSLDALVKPIEVDTRPSNPTQEMGGTALNVAEYAGPGVRLARAGAGLAGKGLTRASAAAATPAGKAVRKQLMNAAGSGIGVSTALANPVGAAASLAGGAAAHLATSPKALATGGKLLGRVGTGTGQVPADLFRAALLKALGGAETPPEQP